MNVSSLYWSFLSSCISKTKIEASIAHVLHFTVLNTFETMLLNSLYWSFLIKNISLNCIESFWLNTLYFNVLKLLEYMYITSKYWIFFSTCTWLSLHWRFLITFTLLHCIEAFCEHIPPTVIKILEYIYF